MVVGGFAFLAWGFYGLVTGDNTITITFILVMVSFSLIGFAVRRQRRIDEKAREIEGRKTIEKNERVLIKKIEKNESIVKRILNRHKDALSLKTEQLKSRDSYGGVDSAAWEREKAYFINTYIVPYVSVNQDEASRQIDSFVNSLPKTNRKNSQKIKAGDGIGYEKFCAEELKKNGWEVRLTKASGDQGVDIIATKHSKKVAIQCKNHSKPVGNKAVQEVHSGMIYERANAAIVVSRKGFTPAARRLANSVNVHLIDDTQIDELDKLL